MLVRLLVARPMLSLATLVVLAAEATTWLHRLTPPLYEDWLPWVVRGLGVTVALAGLALMRCACRRTAKAERDYVINDLVRLHQQNRAVGVRPSGQPEPTAELIATIRSARR